MAALICLMQLRRLYLKMCMPVCRSSVITWQERKMPSLPRLQERMTQQYLHSQQRQHSPHRHRRKHRLSRASTNTGANSKPLRDRERPQRHQRLLHQPRHLPNLLLYSLLKLPLRRKMPQKKWALHLPQKPLQTRSVQVCDAGKH